MQPMLFNENTLEQKQVKKIGGTGEIWAKHFGPYIYGLQERSPCNPVTHFQSTVG